MSAPVQTIRPLPEVDETRGSQTRRFLELRAETAELRDQASRVSADVDALHNKAQIADVERRTAQLAQSAPADLLAEAGDLGMSWSLLAKLVGVTPTAIRKWRRGTTRLTPENRSRLARVIAFCEVLAELNPRITDPVLWLETPLAARTTLRPADLYSAGFFETLLEVAAERREPTEALDGYDAGWRERYSADDAFEVIQAKDGLPSIVPRA